MPARGPSGDRMSGPARGRLWRAIRTCGQRWWRAYHWWVVGGAALVATGLGYVGFRRYYGTEQRSEWDFLYLSLQLFVLESGATTGPVPLSLEVARLMAPAVATYAVAALVATIFRDELTALRTRLARGHVIVCGLDTGFVLARMLRTDGVRVVVIERDSAHPRVETCRGQQIPVLVGDARDEQVLCRAGVRRAGRLVTVCGNDGVNMKIAEQARRLSARRNAVRLRAARGPLRVLVHVGDPYLASLLTMRELARLQPGGAGGAWLDFFSLYSGGARALISQHPLVGVNGSVPHMVVVGLGRLGRQLVVQAARMWRIEEHSSPEPLWITVVDGAARAKLDQLRQAHPVLDDTCELRSLELAPDPVRLLRAQVFDASESPPVSNVFVCLPDDADGLGVGLALHSRLKRRDVPVVIRTYDADLAALVPQLHQPELGGLAVVDQIDRVCRPDQLFAGETDRLAQAIHEVYRHQRRAAGEDERTNPSMVGWEHLAEDKKESNRAQARHISSKLAQIGCEIGQLTDPRAELFSFAPAEIKWLARMEHDRWRAQAPPEHPANIPWDELSAPMKEIDYNFVCRMPAVLATAGFQIDRVQGASPQAGDGPELPLAHRSDQIGGEE